MSQKRTIKNQWLYLLTILMISAVLLILYRDADMSKPLVATGGDEYGVFYYVKTIKEYGWYWLNPSVGGLSGGDMFDYFYSDSLSFAIVKLISLFVDNVYTIANIFYFTSQYLTALVSLYVCKKLQITSGISVVISILYAFSVFSQMRYSHMWLIPYFLLPLCCMVAIWIITGKIIENGQPLRKNKLYWESVAVSFFCAFTGLYYAFFTCVIYAIAIVIRWLNIEKKKIKREIYPISFIGATICGVIINLLPSVLYITRKGVNPASEMAARGSEGAEVYGLKFIQMILPREGHRIETLSNLTQKYSANYPLVNENATATLGFVATIGFLASLIWLLKKQSDKIYSYLNIGLFLIGTVGGVGTLFSLLIPTPMRCYNRISLLIMFISLLCFASLIEQVRKKCSRKIYGIILIGILCVGLFDQTVKYVPPTDEYTQIDRTRYFVQTVENEVGEGGLIFQLPYVNWPSGGFYRMFSGYIESEDLHWSYGAMQGREEALWQEQVANLQTNNMTKTLAYSGYDGIYLDYDVYVKKNEEDIANKMINDLIAVLGEEPLISEDGTLYFWNMDEYKTRLFQKTSENQLDLYQKYALGVYNILYKDGFYDLEQYGKDSFRWCEDKCIMCVTNSLEETVPMTLTMSVSTGTEEKSTLTVLANEKEKKYTISSEAAQIQIPINLKPGKNKVKLLCNGNPVETSDPRNLVFQIRDVEIDYTIFNENKLANE